MSYENFRNDITEELLKTNDADVIRKLLCTVAVITSQSKTGVQDSHTRLRVVSSF